MRKQKFSEEESEEGGGDDWLLTYGDLMTQLVCFFVLIIAFSSTNEAKFQEALVSIQIALGGGAASGVLTGLPSSIDLPRSSKLEIEEGKFMEIKGKIDEYIEEHNLAGELETSIGSEGLHIRLKQQEPSLYFDSAEARIREDAYPILDQIGVFIKSLPNNIRIEGHTDIRPIHTARFPSNWELSTMRATNILKYLNEYAGIAPERLSAAGYGPHKPIASNNTESGMSKNRRVEIIILRKPETHEEETETVFGEKMFDNTEIVP